MERKFQLDGAPASLAEIAARAMTSVGVVRRRLAQGWTPEAIVEAKPSCGSATTKYTLCGKRVTIQDLAELAGISFSVARKRLAEGWEPERILREGRKRAAPTQYFLNGSPVTMGDLAKMSGRQDSWVFYWLKKKGLSPEEVLALAKKREP